MSQKKLIFVLGMHRSGTSACTRMLSLLGVDLGRDLISPQPGVNDKGFWEHAELLRINEALLTQLGSDWYDFRPLPEMWWRGEKIKPHKENIRLFLDQSFSEKPIAALKDPRLCRLLPLWLDAVQESDWDPLAVVVLRRVGEVVASLGKRDPLPESTARLLWLRYVAEAEVASRVIPRSIMTYDGLLGNWAASAERIGAELEIEWPAENEASTGKIGREIDPRLRHHAALAAKEPGPLSNLADAVYDLMSDPGKEVAIHDLDNLWREFGRLFSQSGMFSDLAHDSDRCLIQLNQRLQEIGADLEYARKTVQKRDRTIRENQRQMAELGKAHDYAQGVVRERDGQLEELAKEHTYAQGIVRERDGQLERRGKELERLGKEHAYAQGIVRERDGQLEQLRKEYEDAQSIVRERDRQLSELSLKLELAKGRLMEIMGHPVAGLVCRFFALGENEKDAKN